MGIVDVVLPAGCSGCGRRGVSPCRSCVAEMESVGWVNGTSIPVVAAVAYHGVARDLVVDFKYRRRREALGWMADAVASAVTWADFSADAITWIPASRAGRRRRGFDQGRLLAAALGKRLGLPTMALLDRGGGGRQVGRDRDGRAAGAADISLGASVADAAGARVLVIDDVVTTGASMASAAAALRAAGVAAVVGAAFAHKP